MTMQRIIQIIRDTPNSPITHTCLQSYCVLSWVLKEYVAMGMEVGKEARKENENLSLRMKLFSPATRAYSQHPSEADLF